MIDGHVGIALGGKHWSIPPLKWKIVKGVEPHMINLYKEAKLAEVELELKEDFLDKLAALVFKVVRCADPDDGDPPPENRDAFDDLAFNSRELLALIPIVGQACGLTKVKPNGSGESDEGKQTGASLSLTPAPRQDGPSPTS